MTPPPDILLEASHVTIRFGGLTAVSDFNLVVGQHELVGLIGPNGAGKTTVFNMLTGVYQPSEGTIKACGVPTAGMLPFEVTKLGFARTFQNIRVFKDLSVLDNVKIGGHIHYSYSPLTAMLHTRTFLSHELEAEHKAIELLEIFGLEGRAHDHARNLPYGDQRKLEIARALAARPKLLLLDEPAAGLNESETKELMNDIRSIRDRFDISVLLIEHNMALVMGVCERILVLNYGKTIAEGVPDEIQNNPVVIEAYLGEPMSAIGETV